MAISQNMHLDIEEVLISESDLQARIRELAEAVERDYAGKELVLVGILKGAIMFMVDIARAMNIPVDIDFMAISSYGSSTESSGVVRILKDLDSPITGKHVLVIEDIIDTGLTIQYLMEHLQRRNPASLAICTLLEKEKPSSAHAGLNPAYVGFHVPDRFVVGFGLDYAQKYRNLPYIGVLRPSVYSE